MKEPAGAILYTSGVLLPSLTSTENSLSFFSLSLIFQFFITALINLILFSWFDFERDKKDQRSSLITTVGYQSGKILLAGLFIIQAGITLVLFIFSPRPTVIVVLLLMNLMLLMIFIFAPYFSLQERYRYAGDAIFFLPFLYLMGS
jgi:1,4-dihydroxy-2-naphthoate octaprenyltransferase